MINRYLKLEQVNVSQSLREVVVAVSDPHQGAGAAWNNLFMDVRLRKQTQQQPLNTALNKQCRLEGF